MILVTSRLRETQKQKKTPNKNLFFINTLLVSVSSHQIKPQASMDFLVAPTPSTYQAGRGILFSERHLVYLEQRRIRHQINNVLLAIQTDPAFASHADHFEFLYREYSLSQTPERRASVRAQVEHYARLLSEYQTTGAPEPHSSTPPPSPTSLSATETIYEAPVPEPRLKKAGSLPLSPPPTPTMKALTGNLPEKEFEVTMEYHVYLIEMAASPQKKIEAYMEFYEFLMTQPINMLRCPNLRTTTSQHIAGLPQAESLQRRYSAFLDSLRSHPYYVA